LRAERNGEGGASELVATSGQVGQAGHVGRETTKGDEVGPLVCERDDALERLEGDESAHWENEGRIPRATAGSQRRTVDANGVELTIGHEVVREAAALHQIPRRLECRARVGYIRTAEMCESLVLA